MIERTRKLDRVTIVGDTGYLEVRYKNAIVEDGQELSFTYERMTIGPDDSLEGLDGLIVAAAEAARKAKTDAA